MRTRDMIGSASDVCQLIVKEDVRFKCVQDARLLHSAKKESLVNLHTPTPERSNQALVSGGAARSDDCCPDPRSSARLWFTSRAFTLLQPGDLNQEAV